ncbi:MAG: hypothetical protein LBT41_00510 [Candidatus Methanoplasma sp.]|jgi:hypothetical protein|nr:hypothetical protein [Candidatus Methanoplasma sp.]
MHAVFSAGSYTITADGYRLARWEGDASGPDAAFVIKDVRSGIDARLVPEPASDRSSDDDILGMPPALLIGIVIVLAALAAALLLFMFGFVGGSVEVEMTTAGKAEVKGRKRTRRNRPYRFSVEGGSEASYRVGESGSWKEPASGGGKYEVPKEDVRDRLTIRVR